MLWQLSLGCLAAAVVHTHLSPPTHQRGGIRAATLPGSHLMQRLHADLCGCSVVAVSWVSAADSRTPC